MADGVLTDNDGPIRQLATNGDLIEAWGKNACDDGLSIPRRSKYEFRDGAPRTVREVMTVALVSMDGNTSVELGMPPMCCHVHEKGVNDWRAGMEPSDDGWER